MTNAEATIAQQYTKLHLVPIGVEAAKKFVVRHHRHNRAPLRAFFAVSVADDQEVTHGVAIAAQPVSRMLMDGWTCEVQRCCTDGTFNACSMLYGAISRAAKALGYRRLTTYTLATECGASLRASGWTIAGSVRARGWANENRDRIDIDLFGATRVIADRFRWEKAL